MSDFKYRITYLNGKVRNYTLSAGAILNLYEQYYSRAIDDVYVISVMVEPSFDPKEIEEKGFILRVTPYVIAADEDYKQFVKLLNSQEELVALTDQKGFIVQLIPAEEIPEVYIIEDDSGLYMWRQKDSELSGEVGSFVIGNKLFKELLLNSLDQNEKGANVKAAEYYSQEVKLDENKKERVASQLGYSLPGIEGIVVRQKAQNTLIQEQSEDMSIPALSPMLEDESALDF